MSESICETDTNGNKYWCNDNGELHRTDGPAIERKDGQLEWWVNGELHRTDGPAIEWSDGDRYWYFNDKIHRTDGPAVEYANGDRCWYFNNKIHRTDGPAVECTNGYKEWWIEGIQYSEEKFNEIVEYEQFKQELGELFKI
jgi:hypothetical protein